MGNHVDQNLWRRNKNAYLGIKAQYPDAILAFNMENKCYRMFFDDAVTASRLLGIELEKVGSIDNHDINACTISINALKDCIKKMVESGYKVLECKNTYENAAEIDYKMPEVTTPDKGGAMVEAMVETEFSQKALEWWPFLEDLVSTVNFAAYDRDREMLDNIFIVALNGLGMKVERQAVKQSSTDNVEILLKRKLSIALSCYKNQISDIKTKKKRIKDPIGKYGLLKDTMLKQYQSAVKRWPEKQKKLKEEIKELIAKIKRLPPRSRLYKFKNGTELTSWRGGKYSLIEGDFGKARP